MLSEQWIPVLRSKVEIQHKPPNYAPSRKPTRTTVNFTTVKFLIVQACKNERERKEGLTAINIWKKVIGDNYESTILRL